MARQRDYAAEYRRRIASGRGRGYHPGELRSQLRGNVSAVVPDVTRNARGQITRIRIIVTDDHGKQRTHTIRKPTSKQIADLGDILNQPGVPYLPGYSGSLGSRTGKGQQIMTPGGPRWVGGG